jgi:hypothetical protein
MTRDGLKAILVVLGLIALVFLATLPARASAPHVTICHALGNGGFVQISPSASGVYHGHLGDSHQEGRDIIPPFTYRGQTYSQNWPEGQAIWEAGCETPSPSPSPSPTPSTTPTPSPSPSETPSPQPSPTSSSTPIPTHTVSPTPTSTRTSSSVPPISPRTPTRPSTSTPETGVNLGWLLLALVAYALVGAATLRFWRKER